MSPITDKQSDYIELMLTNRFANQQDKDTVAKQLKRVGKSEISELSVSEASDLIGSLLEREVEYELLCGEKVSMGRQEGHRLVLYGEFEACGHYCPKGIYFAECEHFQAYDEDMNNNQESQES